MQLRPEGAAKPPRTSSANRRIKLLPEARVTSLPCSNPGARLALALARCIGSQELADAASHRREDPKESLIIPAFCQTENSL